MTDFNDEVEKVINIFTIQKRFGVCVLSSALLVNRLGKWKVIEGYLAAE